MYQERFYRDSILSKFRLDISFKESDLLICTDKEVDKEIATNIAIKYYKQIEEYGEKNPQFISSLSPIAQDEGSSLIVQEMITSSHLTGLGPFSCVAGAIAKYVGQELLTYVSEVVIENGGDLFLKINQDKTIGIYLGENFKIESINLKVKANPRAFGIASSSATIGHSLNFGQADLVTVMAQDAIIADGFATALSNRIKKKEDVNKILEEVKNISQISGLVIAFDNNIFLWGDLELL